MEEKAKDMITTKEKALEEETVRTINILKEREHYLLAQLEQANAAITALGKTHDTMQSEMFELKSKHGAYTH
jgi:homeobox protein cut-like